jgi:hypothetical protein
MSRCQRRGDARAGVVDASTDRRKSMKHVLTVALLLSIGFAPGALAQEHPEHPKDKAEAKTEAAQKMTLDELADAIASYIETDSKLKGGYFLVYDAEEKKPLLLQLDKVHKERLASLGNGVYFACTDMKSSAGIVYDLDFFMVRSERGIETTQVAIHKKAGKPRYGWMEENGVWRKVKV